MTLTKQLYLQWYNNLINDPELEKFRLYHDITFNGLIIIQLKKPDDKYFDYVKFEIKTGVITFDDPMNFGKVYVRCYRYRFSKHFDYSRKYGNFEQFKKTLITMFQNVPPYDTNPPKYS